MPIGTRYVFIASMDVDPEKEDLVDEVYDTENVPCLLQVPGVITVTRLKNQMTGCASVSSPGATAMPPRAATT